MRRWSNLSNYEKGNILIPTIGGAIIGGMIVSTSVLIENQRNRYAQELKHQGNSITIERKKSSDSEISNGMRVEDGRYVLPLSAIPLEKK